MLMQQFRHRRRLIRPLLLLWLLCSTALLCRVLIPPTISEIPETLPATAAFDGKVAATDDCRHTAIDELSDCEGQPDPGLPGYTSFILPAVALLMGIVAFPRLRRVPIPARAASPLRFPPPPLRLLKCSYQN